MHCYSGFISRAQRIMGRDEAVRSARAEIQFVVKVVHQIGSYQLRKRTIDECDAVLGRYPFEDHR
jgi:hypothetical protein